MSQGLHASLLSYEFSRRTLAASSSSSSHSPTSLRSRSPQLSSKRPQLGPHGSYSYEARSRNKVKIPVIEETITRGSDTSDEPQKLSLRRTRSSEHLNHPGLVDAAAAISFPTKRGNESPRQAPSVAESRGVPSHQDLEQDKQSITSPRTARPSRPSWARTRSSGVWYQSQKATSSQDDKSVRSVTSTVPKSDSSGPTTIRIEPLKPPPRPDPPRPAATYHITVETPFAEADKQLGLPLQNESAAPSCDSRRRSSIDARKLFSAPLQVFRKVVLVKPSRPSSSATTPAQSKRLLYSAHALGHKSLPRKDQTGITLERVASLLEGHKPPKLLSRFGTRTQPKSVSTASSSEMYDSKQDTAKTVSSTFNIFNKDPHRASTTSSILDMQMGSTPQNSPTELATYKVKRSPSEETEEFLMIDISTRGGTSYLPSEARRVHTPPLPRDNDKGMGRGYFFDYNAPTSDDDHHQKLPQSPQSTRSLGTGASGIFAITPSVEQELGTTLATMPIPPAKAVARVPTSKLLRTPSFRTPTMASPQSGDFYDAKLADIDAMPTDVGITEHYCRYEKQEHCRNQCQTNLAEIRQQQYEAQLDYNIPEHLPSSALCPRNPEYWRVVKSKGAQFRGCWMHGFGEYDIVPGVRMRT